MPGLDIAPLAGAGSKDQDVDLDDLLSDHKAPPGYRVTGRLGQGAFGEARLGQPARTWLLLHAPRMLPVPATCGSFL